MHHIVCSLGLSACENPDEVVETIQRISEKDGILHVIDWNEDHIPPEIEKIIPKEKRLNPEKVDFFLRRHEYEIKRIHPPGKHFFTISAGIPKKKTSF